MWALSKIVGTKSSAFSPFSSLVLGGYQDRTSTPNRKDQREKSKHKNKNDCKYTTKREEKGRDGKGERKKHHKDQIVNNIKETYSECCFVMLLRYDYLITLCSQYLWTLYQVSVFYN